MHLNNKLPWEDWVLIIITFIMGVMGCTWEAKLALKYKKIKRHMTKRINVVITSKVHMRCSYIYTFTGLDEYKGVTFHDAGLEVGYSHEIGEVVTLLINEYNLDKFWFEEAESISHGRGAIIGGIAIFLVFVVSVVIFLFLI